MDALAAREHHRRNDFIVRLVVVLVACLYGYVMASGEDLIGLDYAQLTGSRFAAVPIWPASGRFFPLAFQEYNLLNIIGRSANVYYVFATVQLVLLLLAMCRLLEDVPGVIRVAAIAFFLVLPGVATCLQGLVVPERDLMFCLLALLVFRQASLRTRSWWPAAGTLVAAQYALYLKETAFLIVGGFAATRLLLQWLSRDSDDRSTIGEFLRANWLDIGLILLCVVFLLIYVIAIVPHTTASYAANGRSSNTALNAARAYITGDLLVAALGIAVILRVGRAVSGLATLDPFWDALAISALLFVFGYVALGMFREYYAAPADCIAVLYLTRLMSGAIGFRPRHRVLAIATVSFFVALNARISARNLLDRKVSVQAHVALMRDLRNRIPLDRLTTLYFPQPGGFGIMEFAAFLQFKGMHVAGGPGTATVVFKSAHRYPDDRCWPTQPFRCEFAPRPNAGDLVVMLPGRSWPAEFARTRTDWSFPSSRPGLLRRILERVATPSPDSPVLPGGLLTY